MKLTSPDLSSFLQSYSVNQKIFIGYSGGVDSHVLLHLLANSLAKKQNISAVYIHHGLQKAADEWQLHCQHISADLGVQFLALPVDAQANKGESPEEAARNARYQAFANLITKENVLFFAQHEQDQLETVLLQLFRGAGLKGLSGMPVETQIGAGRLLRPLLETSQAEILNYANTHQLKWVEDPSNQDVAYDRNYLRQQILPLVEQRWQGVHQAVLRSAKHCADAQQLLSTKAKLDMLALYDKNSQSLDISALLLNDSLQQQWLVREWMNHLNLRMPSMKVLDSILGDICLARSDANPVVQFEGCTIRRYQNRLYRVLECEKTDCLTELKWLNIEQALVLSDNTQLSVMSSENGIAMRYLNDAQVCIKYRSGGEKIGLPRRSGRHSLKKLYQEANIPPWQRERLPLIYIDGQIAAIADLWISSKFYAHENESCYNIVWQESS